MNKCNKCGHKMILAIGSIDEFIPDSEPYKSGIVEKTDFEEINIYCSIVIHFCPECENVQDYNIEELENCDLEQSGGIAEVIKE